MHDLVSFVQGLQNRKTGAAAHVGAQADIHLVLFDHRQVEQAAAQKQVGGRAEGNRRTGLRQSCALFVAQVHAMGEHRALAEQVEVIVYIQVMLALGEQRLDPLDLLKVFADVGLHVQAGMLSKQLPSQAQLLRAAGRRESRGHCVAQTPFTMPALDQRLAVGIPGFWRINQIIRRIAVHHHLAGDHAQIECLSRIEKRLDRFFMHAAEHQRCGRTVAQQFLDEDVGHLRRMLGVGELAFAGEGVGVEPVEQLFAVGTDHAGLWQVDMGVDEARCDQCVRVFDQLDIAVEAIEQIVSIAHGNDFAVFDQQQAIGKILIRRLYCHLCGVGNAVKDGGAVGFTAGN
ncbi:hypothetical protein ALP26_05387 [Pseudomonas savastanoi pv. glycinea]|nr:hypothetical protein ALP26_05387 [Pseudomonas savastanoi pv. glycinea]